jgi:phosphoenolpyruvate carboxykinase (ATP)
MFLRPEQELENFTPEWTLLCSSFLADLQLILRQNNFHIRFHKKNCTYKGTGYTGEMKKGTLLNFILPESKILPMHCSANVAIKMTTIFFGLSGTGKTTSADPKKINW